MRVPADESAGTHHELTTASCQLMVEPPGIDADWPESSSTGRRLGAAMSGGNVSKGDRGGAAGNRTRVRKASGLPSFTCVVALTLATGFVDSATT